MMIIGGHKLWVYTLLKRFFKKEHLTIFPYISVLSTHKFNPQFKGNPQQSRTSASFASFEYCLEVTDYKKFDKEDFLPKSIEHFFAFFENHKLKVHNFTEI